MSKKGGVCHMNNEFLIIYIYILYLDFIQVIHVMIQIELKI